MSAHDFKNTGCPDSVTLEPERIESTKESEYQNTGCPNEFPDDNDTPIQVQVDVQAQNCFIEFKNKFKKFIKSLMNTANINIEHFKKQATDEKSSVKIEFAAKIETFLRNTELASTLVSDMDSFMDRIITENVQVMKSEKTDKLIVKAALTIATQFYRNEMEREMAAHQFLPNFKELSNKIIGDAIKDCTTEYELTKRQEQMLLDAMKAMHSEYEEKNLILAPQDSVAVGIDLGTTYSCVSVYMNGKAIIIPNEYGKPTTPSCVAFLKDGSYIVGETAKHSVIHDPVNTSFDAKRLLGRTLHDAEVLSDIQIWPFKVTGAEGSDTPKIHIFGKEYFPEEISARVLHHLKKIAENYLGRKVDSAVITVPAYFNNFQRQATRDAGEIAGLNILNIINEPTAAAMAYNMHCRNSIAKNVLIFDLGGGTFDAAVATISLGEIHIKAVGGDTHLGGQDFDNELVNYCISMFQQQHKIDLKTIPKEASANALRRIRSECEKEKCNLSVANAVEISLCGVYRKLLSVYDLHVPVTREQFENLNKSKFEKSIKVVEAVLKDSNFKKEDIDEIVLVGGSTKIPKIQEMLSNFFGGKTLTKSLNSDEAVAIGAALQAAILNGEHSARGSALSTSSDVASFSIGIRNSLTNELIVYIKKNTPIPWTGSQQWTTMKDWQTSIRFKLFEGEDPIAENNHLLGKFGLKDIPPAKQGVEKVTVKMSLNRDGILEVTAISQSNRSTSSLTIANLMSHLSKEQIAQLKLPKND